MGKIAAITSVHDTPSQGSLTFRWYAGVSERDSRRRLQEPGVRRFRGPVYRGGGPGIYLMTTRGNPDFARDAMYGVFYLYGRGIDGEYE